MSVEACSWCGEEVPAGDGYRASGPDGSAVFCRLEHVVPWVIRGARWTIGNEDDGPPGDPGRRCSHCGGELPDDAIVLVRHRGELRIGDFFCSVEHMRAWAAAGGPYRP
jgi:ribosomal protein L24E